jgi:hypothetical protein
MHMRLGWVTWLAEILTAVLVDENTWCVHLVNSVLLCCHLSVFWLLLPMMINMYAHLHIIDELKLVRDWTFFMLQVPVQMIWNNYLRPILLSYCFPSILPMMMTWVWLEFIFGKLQRIEELQLVRDWTFYFLCSKLNVHMILKTSLRPIFFFDPV